MTSYDHGHVYSTGDLCVRGHLSLRDRWGHCMTCRDDRRKTTPRGDPWPPEIVNRMRKLADTMTASQIAADLGPGYTRNSVIGKCSRMGIDLCKKWRPAR